MKNSLKFIVLAVLVVVQTLFMFIPVESFRLFNMALRPLVYALLTVTVFVFIGLDGRPVRKAYGANMSALASVSMFGVVFLAIVFVFGAGTNVMAENLPLILRNLWERGSIVIFGELIRYKLIKSADRRNRVGIVIALTIVLAFGHMSAIRVAGEVFSWSVFFESIFRPLVISAVASYFAIEGSFAAVVTVSFVYTMTPYLVPIMPDFSPLVWTLITTGLVFVSAIIYRFFTREERRDAQMRMKRMERYARKPIVSIAVTAVAITATISFFTGAFPVYPLVVLTGSMEPAVSRGSLVFVERVPPGKAFIRVDEGAVIHFFNRAGVGYVHRVVDFGWDTEGEREYVTQGDAADIADPFPVRQGDVLGVVRGQLPFLGYPYIFAQSVIRTFR